MDRVSDIHFMAMLWRKAKTIDVGDTGIQHCFLEWTVKGVGRRVLNGRRHCL